VKNLLFIFMLLTGVASALAPFFVPALNGASATVLIGFGLALMALSMALLVIVNVYVKTRASEAFVRTGAGGRKVIMDGGALVIPVIHEMIAVSLAENFLMFSIPAQLVNIAANSPTGKAPDSATVGNPTERANSSSTCRG